MADSTWKPPDKIVAWLAPGLVAGLMVAMFAMVGIVTSTFWAPPEGIAQAVGIRPNGHDFHATPFILGLIGHMMNSVIIGAVFVAIVRALRPGPGVAVVAGTAYGLVVYGVMYWVLLRRVFTIGGAGCAVVPDREPGVELGRGPPYLRHGPGWAAGVRPMAAGDRCPAPCHTSAHGELG